MAFIYPTELMQIITKTDKRTSNLLLAGLAVCAAAAIVVSLQIDTIVMIQVALVVLVLGVVAFCVANVIRHELVQRIVGGLALLLLLGVTGVFAFSAITGGRGIVPPVYCLIKLWERCDDIERALVENKAAALTRKVLVQTVPAPATGAAVARSSFKVFVQFDPLSVAAARRPGSTLESSDGALKSTKPSGWPACLIFGPAALERLGFPESARAPPTIRILPLIARPLSEPNRRTNATSVSSAAIAPVSSNGSSNGSSK